MFKTTFDRRAAGVLSALAAVALLAACMVSPGRFVSSLDIRANGQFTFAYAGEIHMLALSKMAENSTQEEFVPSACYDEETTDERPCRGSEIASQKRDWEAGKQERNEKHKRDAEQMRAILGGIDPSDPEAAEELAERLRRQAGWKRVEYRGDGLFDVEFAITSQVGHDFSFPTFERFPMANPFVQLSLRDDGTVRMDAPGFAGSTADPLKMMMYGKSAAGQSESGTPKMPALDGKFTLTTNAAILANNTDEGPQPSTGGQQLNWKIGGSNHPAPMALIQLQR